SHTPAKASAHWRWRRCSLKTKPLAPRLKASAVTACSRRCIVLDDRVVPLGNVDHSVRSPLHVDRAEDDLVGFEQLDLLARGEAGSVLADDVAAVQAALAERRLSALGESGLHSRSGSQQKIVGQVPAAGRRKEYGILNGEPTWNSHRLCREGRGYLAR